MQPKIDPTEQNDFVTVVSGLPRSGASMIMQMQGAGGMQVLTDELRSSDVSNPKGYYEYEPVKWLRDGNINWVHQAQGKAVKVIAALLEFLPPQYHYKALFMNRDLRGVLDSQKRMLSDQGISTNEIPDVQMKEPYRKHLKKTQSWLMKQPEYDVLYLNYNEIMLAPQAHVRLIRDLLNVPLELSSMEKVVDKRLYRQRNVKT